MTPTLEFVHFTVKAGSEQQFLDLRPVVQELMATMPGLRDAELVQLEDGSWLDLVHWDSREAAAAGQEQLMASPQVAGWLALIDEVKQMAHGDVRASTGVRVG